MQAFENLSPKGRSVDLGFDVYEMKRGHMVSLLELPRRGSKVWSLDQNKTTANRVFVFAGAIYLVMPDDGQ